MGCSSFHHKPLPSAPVCRRIHLAARDMDEDCGVVLGEVRESDRGLAEYVDATSSFLSFQLQIVNWIVPGYLALRFLPP